MRAFVLGSAPVSRCAILRLRVPVPSPSRLAVRMMSGILVFVWSVSRVRRLIRRRRVLMCGNGWWGDWKGWSDVVGRYLGR